MDKLRITVISVFWSSVDTALVEETYDVIRDAMHHARNQH